MLAPRARMSRTMSRFLEALHSGRVLLMDGAMGTELIRAGLDPEKECAESWNLTHPERVRAVHRAYVNAGARCLLTNTFQANPAALAKHGLENRLEEINATALALVRSVCGVNHHVLASIGPLPKWDEASFNRVLPLLRMADALLLETWSASMCLSAVERIHRLRPQLNPHDLPVLFSLAYQRNPFPGLPPLSVDGLTVNEAIVAGTTRHYGSASLGVNCGRDIGIDEILEILRGYRRVTDLPLFARPNAGTPTRTADGWAYPLTPEKLAARLPELLEAGITMFGGCCGTTPAHIAACRPIIDDWNRRHASHETPP